LESRLRRDSYVRVPVRYEEGLLPVGLRGSRWAVEEE
jgi:hypothetical protein